MPGPVGVVATVGEDPGWTPEERLRRREMHRWQCVVVGSEQRLVRISHAKVGADPARLAALEVKEQEARREVERARLELGKLLN